jgi:hypothetical protein
MAINDDLPIPLVSKHTRQRFDRGHRDGPTERPQGQSSTLADLSNEDPDEAMESPSKGTRISV